MKTIFAVLLFCLSTAQVSAAKIEDVVLIESVEKKDETVLKLRIRSAPDSYFYVKIVADDPQAAEKLALVNKKIDQDESFKLDLEIPSFSPSPNGSKYRSSYVKFSGKDK